MNIQAMVDRQQAIAREVGEIRFMQKGTISYQRVPSTQGGTQTGAMRGPYPLLTWKKAGKTRSLRLKTEEEVVWAEQAVGNHRRFAVLCKEFEELSERIAHELRLTPQDAAVAERLKKGLKSRSSKARKSRE
jgi:hypothetical protein